MNRLEDLKWRVARIESLEQDISELEDARFTLEGLACTHRIAADAAQCAIGELDAAIRELQEQRDST